MVRAEDEFHSVLLMIYVKKVMRSWTPCLYYATLHRRVADID